MKNVMLLNKLLDFQYIFEREIQMAFDDMRKYIGLMTLCLAMMTGYVSAVWLGGQRLATIEVRQVQVRRDIVANTVRIQQIESRGYDYGISQALIIEQLKNVNEKLDALKNDGKR